MVWEKRGEIFFEILVSNPIDFIKKIDENDSKSAARQRAIAACQRVNKDVENKIGWKIK